MSDLSDYLRNELLDHIDDTGAWTAPAALYLALLVSAPASSDDMSAGAQAAKELGVSATAGGYTREAITLNAAGTTLVGQKENTGVITFGAATEDWATVVGVWVIDSASGNGNIILQKSLTDNKTVEDTNSLAIAAGSLKFKIA